MQTTGFYSTIAKNSEGIYREKGSKFLAYAFPIGHPEEIEIKLNAVKKQHPKARHHCFAYRIGFDGMSYRAQDDGEPSGTAGKPILGQIDSLDLTNVLIVVVRYFGGKLLGTSGLINAYRSAAREALLKGEPVTREITVRVKIQFEYALMGAVMNVIKKMGFDLLSSEFSDSPSVIISVPQKSLSEDLDRIVMMALEKPEYEIKGKRRFPNLKLEMLPES